jgi:hypothetical protein
VRGGSQPIIVETGSAGRAPGHRPAAAEGLRGARNRPGAIRLDWLAAQGPVADPSPLLKRDDLQRALHGGLPPPGYSEQKVLVALGERDA